MGHVEDCSGEPCGMVGCVWMRVVFARPASVRVSTMLFILGMFVCAPRILATISPKNGDGRRNGGCVAPDPSNNVSIELELLRSRFRKMATTVQNVALRVLRRIAGAPEMFPSLRTPTYPTNSCPSPVDAKKGCPTCPRSFAIGMPWTAGLSGLPSALVFQGKSRSRSGRR